MSETESQIQRARESQAARRARKSENQKSQGEPAGEGYRDIERK